jgi:hypothetical protein
MMKIRNKLFLVEFQRALFTKNIYIVETAKILYLKTKLKNLSIDSEVVMTGSTSN